MDREAIKDLLREVVGPNVELVDHPKWVGLHCPLAPWKHAGGRDTSPSAGISVQEDGTSIFNCYGCHSKGPITYLLSELEKYTGESYRKLKAEIDGNEYLGGALPAWGEATTRKASKLTPLDKSMYLDLYDSAEGHWYLESRGISDDTARAMELLVDPADSQLEERILFPVMGLGGELYGFSGRAVHSTAELKVRDYHGLQKAKLLLGEQLLREDDQFIVVVEGLFDVAKLVEYRYPVVGVMHSGITDAQYRRLLDLGKPLVLMFDNDAAGEDATDSVIKKLSGKLPLQTVKYPKRGSKGKPKPAAKDPCACTLSEVEWMIEHSRIV